MSGYQGWLPPGPPPPLPPRSPRPGEPVTYAPAYYAQYGSLPPPPPGPPPRSPGMGHTSSNVPPPIPPRPAGFETPAPLNTQPYAQPSPSVPPTVSIGHHGTPSEPVMSANSPWISQQPDNVPPSHGRPAVLDIPQQSYQPSISASGEASYATYQNPQESQSSTSQHPPQHQHIMPGVTDSFANLSVSGARPSPPSSYQPGSHADFPPPPPSRRPLSSNSPGHSDPTSASYGASAGSTNALSPPPPPPPPPQAPIPSNATSGASSFQPLAYSLPPSINVDPAPLPSVLSTPANSQLTTSPQNASPPPVDLAIHRKQPASNFVPTAKPHMKNSSDRPPAVTVCIDCPTTFTTTWYTHPSAPDFFICSRCYSDHIYPSRYQHEFTGGVLTDKKPRLCRFSKPRMSKHLFPEAVSRGTLQDVLDWMRRRHAIPECRGVRGAKGSEGIRWFTTKNGDIEHFVACEACYEDYCLTNSLASNLQPSKGVQGETDVWSCDMAIPFVQRAYLEFGKSNAWNTFAEEASLRLHKVMACPDQQVVDMSGRKWYRPKNNDPDGLLICAACYCDQVLLTPDTDSWCEATESQDKNDTKAFCDLAQFNVQTAMFASHDREDYSIFWTAARAVSRQPHCSPEGIENATWYTLPSRPSDFGVCGACHAGVSKPLGIDGFFVPRTDVAPGEKLLCCFNAQHPRRSGIVQKMLETYFLRNPEGLNSFAMDYVGIPMCQKDEELKNAAWYGWDACTICPDCYMSFARGTALADKMPLQGTVRAESSVCEMYSQRMRGLYLEACEKGDPSELLKFSGERRSVYFQTIPEIKMLLFRAKMNLRQQQMLNTTSSFYTNLGAMQEISMPSAFTYSSPGLGGGFHNQHEIQGAVYKKQGWDTFVNGQSFIATAKLRVVELEKWWRSVE